MFNNTAFDIVIGLIFIYLLYSLLATVVSELIATWLGLRARNLKEGMDRMLNDEDTKKQGLLHRIMDSFALLKSPSNLRVNNFYNHAEIKYLGSTGVFKVPSSFKSVSFSKTIIYLLSGEGQADKNKITDRLKKLCKQEEILLPQENILDRETAQYVLSLWENSYGDVVKFRAQLEAWFDRTMEQVTEWYKRKIQIVLLLLGFSMAWFFNADTFTIVNKLSVDKTARQQLVSMASAYVENNSNKPIEPVKVDSTMTPAAVAAFNSKLDSLLAVKRQIETDISNANSLLGSGAWLPDSVLVTTDKALNKKMYQPQIDETTLLKRRNGQLPPDGYLYFSTGNKWGYFFGLFTTHFFGFLITAIAISLGAPFWFDLLNKLMKLRTSAKQEVNTTTARQGGTISPINREG